MVATKALPMTRATALPEAPPYPATHPTTDPTHRPAQASASLFHVKQPTSERAADWGVSAYTGPQRSGAQFPSHVLTDRLIHHAEVNALRGDSYRP